MKRTEDKTTLKCMFCRHVFKRKIGPRTYEVRCPKCKEYDVDVIGNPTRSGGRLMNNPKMPSKGVCPVCKWAVKKGGMRRTVKGVRRWYHPHCFKKAK